jgi:hypothetical protein
MNLTLYTVIWSCIAGAAILLALYRKLITRNEDDYLHVADGEAKAIPQQVAMAQRLDMIDRWEKILLIAATVTGLALGGAYIYHLWVASQTLS